MDPSNFLNAKFDSDEDDDDYVPQKGEASDDDQVKKAKYQEEDLQELTGIAQLKAIKRKKEIDDLWATMQEDDDYYKKKSVSSTPKLSEEPVTKAVKTKEGQRVPTTQQKIPETKPL